MRHAFIALLLCFVSLGCQAQREGFTVVRVDLATDDLRLFWRDDKGVPFRSLGRLSSWLGGRGQQLVFGMNAGMYHADASPVGLLVIDGQTLSPLNLAEGSGNFFMQPNGVFFVAGRRAQVVASRDYPAVSAVVRFATQSGPMLLQGGQINPAFRPLSASVHIRNGVCALGAQVVFVISERPVNFHDFARFFRDDLHCTDALYLDGAISSLYSAALGRSDDRSELGPLVGVVRSAPPAARQ